VPRVREHEDVVRAHAQNDKHRQVLHEAKVLDLQDERVRENRGRNRQKDLRNCNGSQENRLEVHEKPKVDEAEREEHDELVRRQESQRLPVLEQQRKSEGFEARVFQRVVQHRVQKAFLQVEAAKCARRRRGATTEDTGARECEGGGD
jgi:hypothetical protein